jgi:DNA-binding transcriptional LysR family regulator
MHKALRRLPSLDFLKGFEAAGRLLSFTLAARELFLTQSALSRQIQALEEGLGVKLFVRRHRALALTSAGSAFHRAVSEILRAVASAAEAARGVSRAPGLTRPTTVSFASLWIIPGCRHFARGTGRRGLRFRRRSSGRSRSKATSTSPFVTSPTPRAPEGAVRLFGERMLPVVSPKLVRRGGTPLAKPGDLARHVLLHLDDREGRMPWLEWGQWLAANGEPGLKPAGSLRFTLYDQVIQAAVGGQGVALGRIPLIAEHLRDGRLVAPFPKRYDSARGY